MKKIIEICKRFFAKNTGWKVLSLVIAIGLWLSVMNTLNPTETKTFTVAVTLENEDAVMNRGYAVLNKDELLQTKIDVKVTGTRPAIDELSQKSSTNVLVATVDLQQIEMDSSMSLPQNMSLNITPKISNIYLYSYEISSYSPTFLNVSVDAVAETEMSISTNIVGEPAEGYVVQQPVYDAESVIVRGPASKIEQIANVTADIDVDGADSNISESIELKVLNSAGEEMTDFVVVPQTVQADVSVNLLGMVKVNQPAVTGQLHDDLIFQGIEWSPKEIELVGTVDEVSKVEDIVLPEIDLSKLLGSDIYTYEVSQYITENDNLHLKSGTPKTITVKVHVQGKEGKNLSISANTVDVTGLGSDLTARIPDNIIITVFGSSEALENVNVSNVQPKLDLTGLGEGGHQVPLQLTLADGVEARDDLTVYVIISKKAEETTETTTVTTTAATTETTTKEQTETADDNTEEVTQEIVEDSEGEAEE